MTREFSDLEEQYAEKRDIVLQGIADGKDPMEFEWDQIFNNWEHMTLKEGMEQGKDYHMIS